MCILHVMYSFIALSIFLNQSGLRTSDNQINLLDMYGYLTTFLCCGIMRKTTLLLNSQKIVASSLVQSLQTQNSTCIDLILSTLHFSRLLSYSDWCTLIFSVDVVTVPARYASVRMRWNVKYILIVSISNICRISMKYLHVLHQLYHFSLDLYS
jgi:hypothetical protein